MPRVGAHLVEETDPEYTLYFNPSRYGTLESRLQAAVIGILRPITASGRVCGPRPVPARRPRIGRS